MRMTNEELDQVAGGTDTGGPAGVKGRSFQISDADLDAVAGGGDSGGPAAVKG